MNISLNPLQERSSIPSPVASPMGVVYERGNLWVGSSSDWVIRGIRLSDTTVFSEAKAPGKPFGCVLVANSLRVIVSDADDNRRIATYILRSGFSPDTIRCPDDSGSFIAHDGRSLYISQRFSQRLIQIDSTGVPTQLTPVPRQVTGITSIDGGFYMITTDDSDAEDDYRLSRMVIDEDGDVDYSDLATIPFPARSLTFDGTHFWTTDRENSRIVAFAQPPAF